jgi:putative hydrolase of the HAD superfamily
MQFTGIKAVTFDAGGTLLEPWPSVGAIYAAVAREFGYPGLSPDNMNSAFAAAWKTKQQFDYSLPAWLSLVEDVFAQIVSGPLNPEFFTALYQRFARADAWRIYDDVPATLQTLRNRGYRLAVISNWDDRLRKLLSGLQLDHFFEAIVLSVDAGATKPSPQIFERALAAFDLPAGSVLHIGDSVEEDVIGARDSGMMPLLLDRHEATEGSVATLLDLLPLLPPIPTNP